MKASRQTIFRVAALVVAIAAFVLSPEFPSGRAFEAKQRESPRPSNAYARTVPVSNKMITVKYTQDGGDPVVAAQLEGGLIRVELPGKAIYGFSPIITDPASGTVTIKVYRIGRKRSVGGGVEESLKQVHTLIAGQASDKDFTTYADAEASFKIEILNIQTESLAAREGLSDHDLENLAYGCCAECDGRLTCACAVSTACGGCCDGACCH
jgi:hypothetical protein